MASLGKLTPTLGNASIEVAPALANLNFDFALYKIEAPKEFQGVGEALSMVRRERAESGSPHITARKLGALFDRILPSTPELFRVYGRRASEICQACSIDSRFRSRYGPFASQVGTDATSLWAAATSSQGAIAVHLLACMLARMWDGPEATSIWMEIVEKRQQEINNSFEELNIGELSSVAAAKQQISRDQMREWDASARAWLQSADSVKKIQQKQLSLIIDNIKLPVNTSKHTFESVLNTWKSSLTQMEGLVNGISQNVNNGEIILALYSWHLYPDMHVFSSTTTLISQRDPTFIRGGFLTVGIEVQNSQSKGVYWSLPLAHLRHYGAPVVSVQSIDSTERSRISLNEFLQAYLGCFLQGWKSSGVDIQKAIPWLAHLQDLLEEVAANGNLLAKAVLNVPGSWFNLLLSASKYHLSSSGDDRKWANKLVMLGQKYGKDFLGIPPSPIMGFLEQGFFVRLLRGQEEKIACLRKIADDVVKELRIDHSKIFIRYSHQYVGCSKTVYEYTTAVPWTKKRRRDQSDDEGGKHYRWLYIGNHLIRTSNKEYLHKLDLRFGYDRVLVPLDFLAWHARFRLDNSNMVPISDRVYLTTEENRRVRSEYEARKMWYLSQNELVLDRATHEIEDFELQKMGVYWSSANPVPMGGVWFKFLYGDVSSAALFVLEGNEQMINVVRNTRIDSQEFFSLFEDNKMDSKTVVDSLFNTFQAMSMQSDPYLKSLKVVSTAATLYKDMPSASIDIRVLRQKLYGASWVQGLIQPFLTRLEFSDATQALYPFTLDRACAFACLAMFESGVYDLPPSQLTRVMAMSSGSSLFVAASLICDPFYQPNSGAIKHVLGNIGRPGLVFLVPPVDPMIRENDITNWSLVNHEPFDGTILDCFKSTSLHLSFTTARSPIDVGYSGARDEEVYVLETLISVYDQGKWVADVDIFRSLDYPGPLQNLKLNRLSLCSDPSHTNLAAPKHQLTCIDNWFELLDPLKTEYQNLTLVRAHQNWQARLAATVLSVALGHVTLILPPEICWECYNAYITNKSFDLLVAIG